MKIAAIVRCSDQCNSGEAVALAFESDTIIITRCACTLSDDAVGPLPSGTLNCCRYDGDHTSTIN